jgi:hypothetical protein
MLETAFCSLMHRLQFSLVRSIDISFIVFFFERKNSIRHWHPSTTKSKYHHLPCLLVERNSAAKLTVSPLMVAMLVLCVKWSCIEFAGIFIKRRASSSRTFSCCANWMLTRSNASLASTIFLLSHTP